MRDILSEQGRVYRATVNGILTPDEGAKLMAQTREIRATLEAIVTADAMVAANAPPPPPGNVTINILSVPEGHSVAPNDAGDLVSTPMQTIEHMPPQVDAHVEPEVISEPPPAPEPLDPIRERALAAGWTPLPRRPRIV